LDLTEDQAVAASHNGSIFLKVSRIVSSSTATSSVQKTASPHLKQTETAPVSTNATGQPTVGDVPPLKPPKVVSISPKESLLNFGDDDAVPVLAATAATSNHHMSSSPAYGKSAVDI